jgi:hypothetical protein
VSCVSAGNCSASGQYTDHSGHGHGFVVSQASGTWAPRSRCPAPSPRTRTGTPRPARCRASQRAPAARAGATPAAPATARRSWTARSVGEWGTVIEVPGTAPLNARGSAQVNSVSCASAGQCSADGYYTDRSGGTQAFVVSRS